MTYLQVLFLCIIPVMFLLGGSYSPMWIFKWYRRFIKSIGMD